MPIKKYAIIEDNKIFLFNVMAFLNFHRLFPISFTLVSHLKYLLIVFVFVTPIFSQSWGFFKNT